jgi:hypothetical protein
LAAAAAAESPWGAAVRSPCRLRRRWACHLRRSWACRLRRSWACRLRRSWACRLRLLLQADRAQPVGWSLRFQYSPVWSGYGTPRPPYTPVWSGVSSRQCSASGWGCWTGTGEGCAARAENRQKGMFSGLSSAHTMYICTTPPKSPKLPYKRDFLCKMLRPLKRPRTARTEYGGGGL